MNTTVSTPHGIRAAVLAAAALLGACSGSPSSNASGGPISSPTQSGAARCATATALPADQHVVTSWRTAPGDALITHPITGLSVRQSFAPHWAGEVVRLRLSNRYSSVPLTLENVHLALEAEAGGAAMVPGSACPLTFDGGRRITLAAGETAVSDPIHFPVRPFQRVGVSFFAPEVTLQITRHLNANEHLYISIPGDHAADATGAAFLQVPDGYASNFLAIEALEVAAPRAVRTLVAVGDSITDGSGSAIAIPDGTPAAMTATDQRYPNHLQRRLLTAGLPLTVANAGIGGNELLGPGLLPQFGRGLIDRFDADVLSVTGATHVLVMIGTNDSGNALPGQVPSAEAMIAGYTQLIERAHEAGLKIILGTIPPAEGTVIDGLPVVGRLGLPIGIMHGTAEARQSRDAINAWIRAQTLSDGIVDFDACLEDPLRPGYLAPEYNSGDNLHPNPAGYRAMADCVDLDLLR